MGSSYLFCPLIVLSSLTQLEAWNIFAPIETQLKLELNELSSNTTGVFKSLWLKINLIRQNQDGH